MLETMGFSGLDLKVFGSNTSVENQERVTYHKLMLGSPSVSVSAVQQQFGQKAAVAPFVRSATVSVTADAPHYTALSSVAQVRSADGKDPTTALVVDFQAQRTVSTLDGPVPISQIQTWIGTKFDATPLALGGSGTALVTFAEVQTERLLVTLSQPCSVSSFATHGNCTIPTPPSNLELLVGGTRAWFNAGPAVGPSGNPFSAHVDVTSATAAAAAAGQLPVIITLRAATPGLLTLQGEADILERYPVAFPDGTARTVTAASEGVYSLSLPIAAAKISPDRADGWQVERIVLDVSAKLPPTRVLPADGPELSTAARLTVDPDHAFAVRLPAARVAQLAELNGVRLPVSVDRDGAELAGTLRADGPVTGGQPTPGDAIPGGALGPVRLSPPSATASEPGWIDLSLAKPHKLSAGSLWLELQAARGSVDWSLADPQASSADDALVLRRTPGGAWRQLSSVKDVPTYAAAVRIVGSAGANDPLPALVVTVSGDTQTTPVAAVPVPNGTTVKLNLAQPVTPSAVAGTGDWEVVLSLTIATPGSYSFSATELQYRESPSGG